TSIVGIGTVFWAIIVVVVIAKIKSVCNAFIVLILWIQIYRSFLFFSFHLFLFSSFHLYIFSTYIFPNLCIANKRISGIANKITIHKLVSKSTGANRSVST